MESKSGACEVRAVVAKLHSAGSGGEMNWRFWVLWFQIFFSLAKSAHISSISPIIPINNQTISVISMKIQKLNKSWIFLQNLWEPHSTVLSLYAIALLGEDRKSLKKSLTMASLWVHEDPKPVKVADCVYLTNAKAVRFLSSSILFPPHHNLIGSPFNIHACHRLSTLEQDSHASVVSISHLRNPFP
jgi:hypothetical protein